MYRCIQTGGASTETTPWHVCALQHVAQCGGTVVPPQSAIASECIGLKAVSLRPTDAPHALRCCKLDLGCTPCTTTPDAAIESVT